MRLLTSRNSAEERLIQVITRGYELRLSLRREYRERTSAASFDAAADMPKYRTRLREWITEVRHSPISTRK
jgi:hypothetical protein